jgi:hypothetical protein
MKLIEVTWHDTLELSSSDWYSIDEIEQKVPTDKKGEVCQSVGYLYRENDNHIILVQTYQPNVKDPTESSLSGVIVIPKTAKVTIRELL